MKSANMLMKRFHLALILTALGCELDPPRHALPVLDLNGMEQQIVDKIDSLQNAVRNSPDSADAWGKLGMNLYIHDLKVPSIVCFEYAANLDTSEFHWPYLAAYTRSVLHASGALEWYARSQRVNPHYMPLHIRFGNALLQAGRIAEAEAAFKKAQSKNPRIVHAYFGLARIAFTRNNFKTSLHYLRQALSLNPQYGEAYGLLATIYRRMKLFDKSNEAMRVARSLPADTKLSEPIITEVIQEGVSSYWYNYRAREYAARARFHAAIKEYKKSLQYKPSARTYRELGHVYRKLNNSETAIMNYRKSLALKPDDMNTLQALTVVYRQTGEDELSDQIKEKIHMMNRNRPERDENERI
ncbi:MAG: tetratricopeptide repeat protein [bacterium]